MINSAIVHSLCTVRLNMVFLTECHGLFVNKILTDRAKIRFVFILGYFNLADVLTTFSSVA